MLDDLLGRTALKERIAELEEERDRLQAQLDAEQDRRREAVRDRQDAEERVNRLEDRIADLEGQVTTEDGDGTVRSYRGTDRLRGSRLREVLDRLRSFRTGSEGALTVSLEADLPSAVEEAFGEAAGLVNRAAPCLAITDDAGLVVLALEPPLQPDPFVEWDDRFRLEAGWFLPRGSFALALIRSDLFAYGEYEGTDRGFFEGFESEVKGAHSKGGFSQDRFDRRRDEQIEAHLDRCRAVLDERTPSRLILVGERTVIGDFDADAVAAVPVDATGDPEDALADAFRSFWTTKIYRI